jgi:hypothetical protein
MITKFARLEFELFTSLSTQVIINEVLFLGVRWGGENRHVYRWNFNPIFVPYPKVSELRGERGDP